MLRVELSACGRTIFPETYASRNPLLPVTASKKPTPRKIATYLAALVLLVFADPQAVTFVMGCGLVLVAWCMRIWAFGHLEKNQIMVTTGPYAHSRNPAYFGSFLALLGVALAAGNPETSQGMGIWVFAAFTMFVFFRVYLPRKFAREYPRLEQLFGDDLRRHAEHVPDFWPQLRAWRSGDPRRFSWRLVGENHEWPWGMVLGLALFAIWNVDSWSPFANFFANS